MRDETTGSGRSRPTWRLVGRPAPTLPERLGRLVGLRVLRVPGSRRVFVLAGSLDRIRQLQAQPGSLAPTSRAAVVVAYWRAPWRGWSGGVGALDHLIGQRVSLPRWGRGSASVGVRLARPAPLRDVLDAMLGALAPARALPAPASADLTGQAPLPAYLPAQPGVSGYADEPPHSPDIRDHDVLLRPPGPVTDLAARTAPARPGEAAESAADTDARTATETAAESATGTPAARHGAAGPTGSAETTAPAYAVRLDTSRHGLSVDGRTAVLVDARRVNPCGRRGESYRPDAPRVRLEFGAAGRWTGFGGRTGFRSSGAGSGSRAGGRTASRSLDGPGLDAADLASLRQVAVVDCPQVPQADPVPTAGLLVQLAMTGVVVRTPDLPGPVADLIAPDLRRLLTSPVGDLDALGMEARSVRQRRAAMRGHATAFALPRLTAATFPDLAGPPSVSAILATRRPEMLATALPAIIGQSYPELEIVLCLHGFALPERARAVLTGSGRPFEVVSVPATASFGEALGAATRRARGSLVTKFDDDDSYGSEHVWDLVLARHYSGATLVGKGTEFVHLENLGVTVRRPSGMPEYDGELVAGGTMLIAKGDLEAVGGWRPVPRSVDLGLIQRLRRDGARIYRTHPLGYVYHRRETGHTWDPGQRYFLDTAYARWDGIPSDALGDDHRPAGVTPEPVAATA